MEPTPPTQPSTPLSEGEVETSIEVPESGDAFWEEGDVRNEFRRRSRRAFLTFGVSAAAALGGWKWLTDRKPDGGVQWPLRRALNVDDRLARTVSRPSARVATLSASEAQTLRVNGLDGMVKSVDRATWKITVMHKSDKMTELTMADIDGLKQHTQTVLHKCIEGWSVPVTWSGPRVSDLLSVIQQRSGVKPSNWVGLATPTAGYYVSLDWDATQHPQALFATKLNNRALSLEHGSPVRLALPTHYGVKSLKQVGIIAFTDKEPPDYWGERGYDRNMAF